MTGHRILAAGTVALTLLGGAIAWTAGNGKEPPAANASFAGKASGADLYALTEAVARRARDLDLADQRIQEERKLLEAMKEEIRKDLTALDAKLSALEKRDAELASGRKANRQYISRMYRAMGASEASKRLTLMGEQKAAALLREMKEKESAKILAEMDPAFSVSVTKAMEKL